MYMRVVHEELRFPEDKALDKETKSFIRGLLQKDPAFRLCEPRESRFIAGVWCRYMAYLIPRSQVSRSIRI